MNKIMSMQRDAAHRMTLNSAKSLAVLMPNTPDVRALPDPSELAPLPSSEQMQNLNRPEPMSVDLSATEQAQPASEPESEPVAPPVVESEGGQSDGV